MIIIIVINAIKAKLHRASTNLIIETVPNGAYVIGATSRILD